MPREKIPADIIDGILLAQAAESAGVVVTEDDVTMAINAAIVQPLQSPDTPDEIRAVLEAAMKAAGVPVDQATKDPRMREHYRRWILANHFVFETGASPDEVLAEARADASIEVMSDVLND
jgi:hypothetical protein